jgi:hypothetical protein
LKGVQSGSDLDALVVPDQNPLMARLKNSLWVPPLVLSNILDAKSLAPSDLIPLLSVKFQEFNRSSTNVKACTILQPVLEFLWAVHKKLIPATILAMDGGNDAAEWSARLHFAYICAAPALGAPPPFPVPPAPGIPAIASPFRVMTDELRRIHEANERQLLYDTQVQTKKESNGRGKLPDLIQKMIL